MLAVVSHRPYAAIARNAEVVLLFTGLHFLREKVVKAARFKGRPTNAPVTIRSLHTHLPPLGHTQTSAFGANVEEWRLVKLTTHRSTNDESRRVVASGSVGLSFASSNRISKLTKGKTKTAISED